ncbi:MAG: DUF2076 domain-containing protein [Pseudomonadota bacterium]|nr:DUF2076 domain-containing protein [Pseudomonadota bacterium]
MTNEEREIIAAFIARVGGGAAGAQSPQPQGVWGGASVPAPQQRLALPPVDAEADSFISQQFQAYPEARYRITQLAFVQEHALIEAQNRLRRLEWELQQTQQAAQQQASQQNQPHGGGLFSGLFGGGRSQSSPPPQQGAPWGQGGASNSQQAAPPPQYPPGYQPGVFQRLGSGFLGSALTTAAGVAGGMVAADALRGLFSPHQGLGSGFGGDAASGLGGGAWGANPPMSPNDQGYVDQGSWDTPASDSGQGTDAGWGQGSADQSGWTDPGSDPNTGGGLDQGGGSDDDSLV